MIKTTERPLVVRILTSWVLWTVLFLVLLGFIASWSSASFRGNVSENQAQFVADNVRRSAIQCYAIEGRFPSTEAGIKYLEDTYGLAIDHTRYRVYYESMASNIVPQIRVVEISGGASSVSAPGVDNANGQVSGGE
jgi:hypothetical protein